MRPQSYQSVTGTILVVDDQAANRELLEEFLSTEGFKVITVDHGSAAIQQLASTQIDLVLLDVTMPGITGFEVCKRIKSNPETDLIPVVLITALSEKQNRLEGISARRRRFSDSPGRFNRAAGEGTLAIKAEIAY